MQLFKIKTTWLKETPESGAAAKVKTEELVEATSFTEAEKVAYAIAEREGRMYLDDEVDINIQRVDGFTLLYQPVMERDEELVENLVCLYFDIDKGDEVGLYNVKVVTSEIDEKCKVKQYTHNLLVPASSNGEASKLAKLHAKKYMASPDAIVKDVKFNNASALYLTQGTYQYVTTQAISLD